MGRWVVRILGLALVLILVLTLLNMQKKLAAIQRARAASGTTSTTQP
jgi:hypothetical protein